MKKATEEFLTGLAIGLILMILLAVKVMAAPIEPDDILEKEGVEIPEEIEFWCEKYGKEYGICPEILEATCWVESRCEKDAQSPDKKCKGLMQINPNCHKDRMNKLKAMNVFGTWENIKTGTDYLAELNDEDDIAVALTKYNGQSEEKIAAAKRGNYSPYVKKILAISEALERAHNK